jgi:hypothetical protein
MLQRLPPAGILRPNALARSRQLSFAYAFQNGISPPFVTRGRVANASYHFSGTTPELYAAPGGIGFTGDGWGGNDAGNSYALSQTAGTVLIYLSQYVDGGSTIRRWFSQFGPAGDNQHRMEVVGGNFSFGWLAGGVNRLVEASAVGYYTAGRPFTVASTWDASGQAAYASGRRFGTGTAGYANTAGSNIAIGYLPGFGFESGRIKPSALHYMLVLDRALSADEIAEAERDPWWWVDRPARISRAGRLSDAPTLNNYALTAEPGSFALTGQPVALRAGRRLALAAGTFALSGQAVALLAGRRLALAAGAFALAGQPVALRAARRLPLVAGSFTLAGQPVALRAARRLVLAPGSFALVGQPVTLSYSENLVHRTLVAEPGSFAVVGQDVRLLAGRRIALAAGAFSLSGQPVTLRAARRMQLGAGAVALTGQDVRLLAGRRMTIDAATLALTGQPVQLLAARRLSLNAGAFALAGQPVGLAWSGAVPIFVPASRTARLPARLRVVTLPPRRRIVTLPPERI